MVSEMLTKRDVSVTIRPSYAIQDGAKVSAITRRCRPRQRNRSEIRVL